MMVAALLLAITLSVSSDASGAPNIVFVMLDDVGFADVGDYAKHALPNHGGDVSSIPTPVFDELARDGVRLTQYYSQPTCTPTRASFLTGRYAINHGLSFPITPGSPVGLPRHMATLPQELRKLGYRADMVGKWHMGHAQQWMTPVGRGFETFVGCYMWDIDPRTKQMFAQPWTRQARHIDWVQDFGNGTIKHRLQAEHATSLITLEAVRSMQRHRRKPGRSPLFLYVSYTAAHSPLLPMEEHDALGVDGPCSAVAHPWRRDFCGMVAGLNDAVRNLTSAIIEDLGNNSLLVVASDNGGSTWFGGNNQPLRGGKTTAFEGGVRVPAFIKDFSSGQLHLGGGHQWDGLMHVSDWMPTLLRLGGYDPARLRSPSEFGRGDLGSAPLDGFDLADAIRTLSPSPRHEILHEVQRASFNEFPFQGEDVVALRSGKWKLVDGVVRDPYWYREPTPLSWPTAPVAITMLNTTDTSWWSIFGEILIRLIEPMFGATRFDTARVQLTHGALHTMFARPQVSSYVEGANPNVSSLVRLYDISADPTERANVAATNPDVVARLRVRIGALVASRISTAAKWWIGLNPQSSAAARGLVPGDCSAMPDFAEHGYECLFAHPWIDDSVEDPFDQPRHQFDAVKWGMRRTYVVIFIVLATTATLMLAFAQCAWCVLRQRVAELQKLKVR